jgi:hypothetical protein
VIVVATGDFEVYHDLVGELRGRSAEFTTVEPGEALPAGTRVVVVGPEDPRPDGVHPETGEDVEVVVAAPEDPQRTVETALARLRGSEGRTVVGVDPGTDPGIAVLSGETVVSVHQVPVDRAGAVVREVTEGVPDPLVRIGDGARLHGARIVQDLDDLRVELVDETGTTPHLGVGTRGVGDVVAAINIARQEGEVIENRDVEPTEGELQVIKNRSRRRSGGRTIDDGLARRVASGELTVEEALDEHAERGESEAED